MTRVFDVLCAHRLQDLTRLEGLHENPMHLIALDGFAVEIRQGVDGEIEPTRRNALKPERQGFESEPRDLVRYGVRVYDRRGQEVGVDLDVAAHGPRIAARGL